MHPLDRFDSFEGISNEELASVYYEALRESDLDLPWLEKEMQRRGLLGIT